MKRVLVVRWGEQTVGQLTQDEHGDLGFVYATTWLADPDAPPLSALVPTHAGHPVSEIPSAPDDRASPQFLEEPPPGEGPDALHRAHGRLVGDGDREPRTVDLMKALFDTDLLVDFDRGDPWIRVPYDG